MQKGKERHKQKNGDGNSPQKGLQGLSQSVHLQAPFIMDLGQAGVMHTPTPET